MTGSPRRRQQVVVGLFAMLVLVLVGTHAGGDVPAGSGSPPPANADKPADPATAAPDGDAPKKALTKKEIVTVGAYLNDIQAIDLKLHNYVIDIYLWFRWKSPDIDPSQSFEFTNANQSWTHVRTANYEQPRVSADGTRYQVVHVQGNFSHKFLLHNYPFDRQAIEVSFEDAQYDNTLLQFVPDTQNLAINDALVLPGFRWENEALTVSDNRYPTNFGNPDAARPETYSRVTLRLEIYRPRGTYAMKLLLPIVCVILCTALMFLLRPTYIDARWSIGITALLTIVALQITLNDDLPDVDYLVLMDKIYIGAYLFVIFGLGTLVYTGKLVDRDDVERAKIIDRRAIVILLGAFTLVTTTLVALAIKSG